MDEKLKEINGLPVVEDLGGGVVENTPLQESESPSQPPAKPKRGRPKGSKNKETLFKELMTGKFQSIAEQNIQKTFEVLFEEAQSGNMQAIKMIMDRVVPASKAVELGEVSSKGLTVEIHIGSLEESPLVSGEIVEEGEFEEVEDGEV